MFKIIIKHANCEAEIIENVQWYEISDWMESLIFENLENISVEKMEGENNESY